MIRRELFRVLLIKNLRKFSTKAKPKIEVNEKVVSNIENGILKARKHPGIFKPRTINLPEEFINAAEKALADYPVKQLLSESKTLRNYLSGRHPPVEVGDYKKQKSEIETKVFSRHINSKTTSNEEISSDLKSKLKWAIQKQLQTQIYHWKPINFDIYNSLQYLLGRSAGEYAALVRIFQEIVSRDPDFKPRSLFDFGSGVGTTTWAAKLFWKKYIYEYFNVDASADMNDLALILLKGGLGMKDINLKGTFFRQFLPATNISYDIVVSAYSLLELPSSRTRLETILKLWNKTENYLVIVEQGTNAGFKIVSEARDFILDIQDNVNKGFAFSPCPHEMACPRFLSDSTPCNFEILYMTMPIGQNSELNKESYSYIVLKKGKPNEDMDRWPRIVRPTIVRSKHTVCRLCTANGKLEEVIFSTAKQGKTTYHCARSSKWGDLLPIKVLPIEE